MKSYVALGSNLGNRKENLEQAAAILKQESKSLRAAPIFQTPALVPPGAPPDWRKPYLNSVVEIDWGGNASDLFQLLKRTETSLGRTNAERWSPRLIDLDLLLFGNDVIHETNLTVPHKEILNREFVLGPLKHLAPTLTIPRQSRTVLENARQLPSQQPLWMGILNITPDSFSDAGELLSESSLAERLDRFEEELVHIIDIGCESTRPGATPLTADEEWKRLKEPLTAIASLHSERIFKPLISVDTYHPETAFRAIQQGADIINDVSGLKDPSMLSVLQESKAQYVLMHSLSVPADSTLTLKSPDPVLELINWAEEKIALLEASGISRDRIIFDPGVGFGKTPHTSLEILQSAKAFLSLPVRTLFGHSRKSFLTLISKREAQDRDPETLGASLRLADAGIDTLRVHEPHIQSRAFQAYQGTALQ